ncbi:hypothetical protein FOZ62_017533 [Perkinsus olseni]|uniref:Uncharacterized protein n=1 Tax=Perkinsus olseni TaxID=32597 RepID=A0A7J6QB98_PEROL|nr:hypothetical protein FOZ62_017533 [Perkinsus olseni]
MESNLPGHDLRLLQIPGGAPRGLPQYTRTSAREIDKSYAKRNQELVASLVRQDPPRLALPQAARVIGSPPQESSNKPDVRGQQRSRPPKPGWPVPRRLFMGESVKAAELPKTTEAHSCGGEELPATAQNRSAEDCSDEEDAELPDDMLPPIEMLEPDQGQPSSCAPSSATTNQRPSCGSPEGHTREVHPASDSSASMVDTVREPSHSENLKRGREDECRGSEASTPPLKRRLRKGRRPDYDRLHHGEWTYMNRS